MSSPNLESLNNELSKLGAHFKRLIGETETPKAPPPMAPLPDAWWTFDRLQEIDFKVSIWRACNNELSKFGELSQ